MKTSRSFAWRFSLGISLGFAATMAFAQDPIPTAPSPSHMAAPQAHVAPPAAPKSFAVKGLDGKLHSLQTRNFTINTHPEIAGQGVKPMAGRPALGQAMGNQGIKQGMSIVPAFGHKGEHASIAFGAGEFVPPAGERLQSALAQRAQARLAQRGVARPNTTGGGPSVYGLILLNGRMNDSLRATLTGMGVALLGYYPNAAFQARIPAAALSAVAALPQVRWVGQPNAAQKLSPELRNLVASGRSLAGTKAQFWVTFFGEDKDGQMRADLQTAGADLGVYDPRLALQSISADASILSKLVNMDAVLYVEPVRTGSVMNFLGMTTINADWLWGGWDPAPSSTQVKMGLLDTGFYAYHQDFSNILSGVAGFSLVSGENVFNDLNHHGTHVSGTMLGEGNADYRYRGVAAGLTSHNDWANNPDYLIAQVFDQTGHGNGTTLIQGMGLLDTDYSAGYKRQVINFSGGGYGSSATDPEARKVDSLYGDNVLMCIAAGNSGSNYGTVSTPGDAKGALTVGAIYNNTEGGTTADTITSYSSRGPISGLYKPDIVSPGSWVDSTLAGTSNGYTYDWNGTSMATPHVAGVAASVIGQFGMPAWAVKTVLMANAIDLGYDRDTQGLGKVDALASNYAIDGNWHTWWWANGGTGDIKYVDVYLDHPTAELRFVMTYPDPPGTAGASNPMVNDLDLYVQYSATQGGLTTDLNANWWDDDTDPVESVKIANAPAGYYRFKVYSYNVSTGSQNWATTVRWIDTSIHPNVSLNLNLPYAVQPNQSFYADVTAYSNAFIASGVVGSISQPSSVALDGLWFKRQSNPASNTEWMWFPNPWTSGGDPPGYYEVPQMNMGNIAAGYTREMEWQLQGASEGTQTISYSVNSVNGGSGTASGKVIVDGTAPAMGTPASQNWTQSLSCDVVCSAHDTLSGLNPSYAYYQYSTNGGSTWSGWYAAACTGGYGTTATQTLTASAVPFGQNNASLNLIQFAVYDAAFNLAYSAITGVSTAVPSKLALSPASVVGSLNGKGTVTLSAAAPAGGAVVALTNTNPKASVPATVTVPGGATSAQFTFPTTAVTATVSGTVTATYGGVSKSATLKVIPIGVKSVTLTPTSVTGGSNVNGKVTLAAPAAPGSITVSLSSSNTAVGYPTVSSITIPAGSSTGTFTVATKHVAATKTVTISATANSVTKSKTLTVNP